MNRASIFHLSCLAGALLAGVACGSSGIPDAGLSADAARSADASRAADASPAADASLPLDAALQDAVVDGGEPTDAESTDLSPSADAQAPDAEASDAGEAQPDATSGDGGCPVPASRVDGPFAAGPPPSTAHLLLTDTASNAIFRLSLDGRVLDQWPSPAARTFGVTHDRRSPDGFWVMGAERTNQPNLFRISFAGTITASLSAYNPNGINKGLDFILSDSPGNDLLAYPTTNSNAIQVLFGRRVFAGVRWFEGGMQEPSGAQFFGVHVERYACDDGRTLIFWTTRDGTALELREWPPTLASRELVIPGTNAARGVTRTPRGDFFVVDDQNNRVLHLTPDAVLIDSFATPGRSPADVSYGE